jgi:hypothetical protein
MRNSIVILLLILTLMTVFSCTDEYDITVINKSTYPIDFEFKTGHRLVEYRLNPEEEWRYSLLKSLGHSMGTFKHIAPAAPVTKVDFRYSDNVYTFYDAYTLTFSAANAGTYKKDQKLPPALTVISIDEIQMPDGNVIWENWDIAGNRFLNFIGWAENTAGTGTIYYTGTPYSFNTNKTFYTYWE